MIIKQYKDKNKIVGYISMYFDDQDGKDVYVVYMGKPNKGYSKNIGSFYDEPPIP